MITMTEQPSPDQPGCSAASVQTPVGLHIDLPHVDPEDICFTINKCLAQIMTQRLELMTNGFMSCGIMTALANFCMDIIQTFAETILDFVMPQVYGYMRIYGSFSATILDLTENRIHAFLGDSIEQALAKCLKIKNFVAIKKFFQLLLRYISKTINSVLVLSTQTPIPESRLPVVFVSGSVTSIRDLQNMVCQIANILTRALGGHGQSSQTTLCESSEEMEFPIFCLNSLSDLKKLVKIYIIRMVKVLKSEAQIPSCKMSSCNHRDVCLRVGTNTHILTVEDRGSHEQQSATSSYSGLDAIPGAVPNSEPHSESCLFNSVTVTGATEDYSHHTSTNEMETIKNIADELVQTFLEDDVQGAAQTDSCQKAVPSGQEVINNVKIRELTDRIFNMVMSGHDYQVPLVPAGTRICHTVTYRKLRRGHQPNPSIVTHALYMRTEEVVTRCAVQALLWAALRPEVCDYLSPVTSEDMSDDPDFVLVPRHATGDCTEVVFRRTPSPHNSVMLSQDSNATYDAIPQPQEPTESQMLMRIVHTSLLSLIVGEMLIAIGIRNTEIIFEVVQKVVDQIRDVDPMVYEHFHASVMGQSYKDIYQTAITNLLLEFGSVQVMQEAVTSGDPNFQEAIWRVLRKQLRVSHGNAAKKTICGVFKKFKRLCCKETWKESDKTTTVISLTSNQDDSELQDHLSKVEPLKEQREQQQCPLMRRIATSTGNMCSSSKKMFSSIARALCRPFIACFRPKSRKSFSTDGTEAIEM